ncbi:MAG: type II toxin-antitoxin system PemK/MazF family toxin [Alkalimonas sp.]|nr:type II toxin-antitoxin system PemK/MazF family toxin [Alkalimonas sp.]
MEPGKKNGLVKRSQIMIDKATTIPREKAGKPIGNVELPMMLEVERCLAVFLGIAK